MRRAGEGPESMSAAQAGSRCQTSILVGDRRAVRPDRPKLIASTPSGWRSRPRTISGKDPAKTGIGEDRLAPGPPRAEVAPQVAGERERLATDGRSDRGAGKHTPGRSAVRPSRPASDLPAHRRASSGDWRGAGRGPSSGRPRPRGPWGAKLDGRLEGFAFAVVHGGVVQGGVVIGTRDVALAQRLVENIGAVFDFSTAPSALLGERLHAHLRTVELWNSVTGILADRLVPARVPADRGAGHRRRRRLRGRDSFRVGTGTQPRSSRTLIESDSASTSNSRPWVPRSRARGRCRRVTSWI